MRCSRWRGSIKQQTTEHEEQRMAEPDNLTQEMLRRLHSKLDDIQGEMRLRFTGVDTGLAAIEQPLSAFHAVDAASAEEIADLRRRLERVERRLELAD
jgi:tetrahydromethanopterin S-methyltransferase subunit G